MKKLTRNEILQRDTALADVLVAMTRHDEDCIFNISDDDECDCDGEINGGDLIEYIGEVRAEYAEMLRKRK